MKLFKILIILGVFIGDTAGFACTARSDKHSKNDLQQGSSIDHTPTLLTSTRLSVEHETQLNALGYITSIPIEKDHQHYDGVTTYLQKSAYQGLNAYCSENSAILKFLDMHGNLIHHVDIDIKHPKYLNNFCKTVAFFENGDFVMVIEEIKLVKAGLDGRIHWELKGSYHHDVSIASDGTVYAIRNRNKQCPQIEKRHEIRDNLFVKISPNGDILEEVSLVDMLIKEPPLLRKAQEVSSLGRRYNNLEGPIDDIFHVNSIDVVRQNVMAGKNVLFRAGQILFASRYLNTIGVFSFEKKQLIWHWGNQELQWPHHPTLQPDGTILVFDNGVRRKYSRVLKISPVTNKINWQYVAPTPSDFFNRSRGGVQGLPNGNVLITDSVKGHVFEVDQKGQLVWDFWNPDRTKNKKNRSTIFRMQRLNLAQTAKWSNFLSLKSSFKDQVR